LLAFLLWNWPPATVFMGDSGSTVLGGAVAVALLQTTSPKMTWLADAHKSHVYQRLNQSGWSHARVATAYVALTLVIAGVIATLT